MNQASVSLAGERAPAQPARQQVTSPRLPRIDSSSSGARAEGLMLLLFLHARPCRAFAPAYLERKLGFSCFTALEVLQREGLVVSLPGEPTAFTYGVEDPELLAAVDELSRGYHAVCALLQLVAALVGASAKRRAYLTRLNKPKQSAPLLCAERGSSRRRPRLRKRFPLLG